MGVDVGIKKLDDALNGGLPDKSSILLIGPPKCGKTIFGMQFLFSGLSKNEYGICIVTNDFPEDFVKRMESFGEIDRILGNGILRFVDCYSVHVGIEKNNTLFIIRVNGPSSLNEMNIAISKILNEFKGRKLRFVMDSTSTLLLYNSPTSVAEFVQVVNGKIKAAGATGLFIVEEGAHDEKNIATLDSILDAVIRIKSSEKKLELKGFGQQNIELDYTIEGGRIACG